MIKNAKHLASWTRSVCSRCSDQSQHIAVRVCVKRGIRSYHKTHASLFSDGTKLPPHSSSSSLSSVAREVTSTELTQSSEKHIPLTESQESMREQFSHPSAESSTFHEPNASPPSCNTHLTDDSVWRNMTDRLLQLNENKLDGSNLHQIQQCISWWARQRPITSQAVDTAWKLLLRSSTQHMNTDLLNTVLDRWRLAIKDSVIVTQSPEQVYRYLQSIQDSADTKSYSILLSAMAYYRNSDPHRAMAILNNLPSQVPKTLVLWNGVLTVWAKSSWPDAAEQALQLFQQMQESSVTPNEISYACVLEAISNSRNEKSPQQAEQLYYEMQQEGLSSPQAFLHVLQAWSKSTIPNGASKAHQKLNELVTDYRQNPEMTTIVPSRQFYSAVMAGYARRGNPEKVQELLQELHNLYDETQNERFLPTAATFNSVFSAYARCHLPDRAQKAQDLLFRLQEMAETTGRRECLPDTTSINTVVHAWAESSEPNAVEGAEALLQAMFDWPGVELDSYTYTSVMKAWARSNRPEAPERCEAFLKAMWNTNDPAVKPNDVTYGTVMYAWSRSKQRDAALRAEAVFADMMKRFQEGDASLKPTETSYVTLMMTWAQSKRKEARARVEYYFDEMRGRYMAGDESLRPTVKAYNALLESKKRTGDGRGAELVLERLYNNFLEGDSRAKPNMYTFHSVMSAWAKSKDPGAPERAEAILMRMQDLYEKKGWDCKPNTVGFTIVLNCWAKSGRSEAPERAEAILRHMQEMHRAGDESIQPSSHCYATVINAWARSGVPQAPDRAQLLFEEMMQRYEAGDDQCKPSSVVYVALLTAWARSSRGDAPLKALAILNEMEDRYRADSTNDRPNSFHYSAVINAFAAKGDVKNAEALLQRILRAEGIEPHSGCFNGVVKAYARSQLPDAFEKAEAILGVMQDDSRMGYGEAAPTVITYTILFDILRLRGRPDAVNKAQSLLQKMLDRKVSPNVHTFLAFFRLLAGAQLRNKGKIAKEAMELMRQCHVRPNRAVLQELDKCRRNDNSSF